MEGTVMNKEQLLALGLTEEQVKSVIEGYGIMIPKGRLDEKIAELKTATDLVAERDKQIEKLGNDAKGNEELQAQIAQLTEDNKKAAEAHAAELHKTKYDTALEKALTASKAKNVKALTALLDLDKVKLDGKELTGLEDQIKALKESESYLFAEEKVDDPEPPVDPKPRFSYGQNNGQNDPVDAFQAKLAKYKK